MIAQVNINRIIFLAVFSGLLFAPLPVNNLWWREAINCGHTILFVPVFVFVYSQLNNWKRYLNPVMIYLATLIAGMLLGVVVELLQGLMQRESSLDDLLKNFLGLMAGGALVAAKDRSFTHYRKIFVSGAVCFLFIGMYSLFELSVFYVQRAHAFPILVEFDSRWSAAFISFNQSEMQGVSHKSRENEATLYDIQLESGLYSGVSITEPVADWSAYSFIRFDVWSHNKEATELVLRVHDEMHNQEYIDRFNQKLILQPGLNKVKINLSRIEDGPVKRKLDLSRIAGLNLFAVNLQHRRLFGLSEFVLQ